MTTCFDWALSLPTKVYCDFISTHIYSSEEDNFVFDALLAMSEDQIKNRRGQNEKYRKISLHFNR